MEEQNVSLAAIYEGWEGYNTSLVRAITPLSEQQLVWRPAPSLRSVGEVAAHIAFGRIDWFHRMKAPAAEALAPRYLAVRAPNGEIAPESGITTSATELVGWMEASWRMVAETLAAWTVADLPQTYLQAYQGKTYAVSRQWTIWRIMAHDIHHGGQLAVMLNTQGIYPQELGYLGGHITEPPEVDM